MSPPTPTADALGLHGRPLSREPSLEGREWENRRPLTPAEEDDAWKIARITAILMGSDFLDQRFEKWEDAVRLGASLLEISRRYVVSESE